MYEKNDYEGSIFTTNINEWLKVGIIIINHNFFPPFSIQNKIAEEVKRRMQKGYQSQKEAKKELETAKIDFCRRFLQKKVCIC